MAKLDNLDPNRLASNPRATERAWLRFSNLILAAYRQHPRPYLYAPQNTKPSSTVCKIRDAIRGALAFGYADNLIAREDLTRWWSEITVTSHLANVRIGPTQLPSAPPLEGEASSTNGLSFASLTFEEICAFTLLLGNGRLSGPIRVKQPVDLSLLTDRLNVEVITKEDGSVILL